MAFIAGTQVLLTLLSGGLLIWCIRSLLLKGRANPTTSSASKKARGLRGEVELQRAAKSGIANQGSSMLSVIGLRPFKGHSLLLKHSLEEANLLNPTQVDCYSLSKIDLFLWVERREFPSRKIR